MAYGMTDDLIDYRDSARNWMRLATVFMWMAFCEMIALVSLMYQLWKGDN
jgi:hypothetical protein